MKTKIKISLSKIKIKISLILKLLYFFFLFFRLSPFFNITVAPSASFSILTILVSPPPRLLLRPPIYIIYSEQSALVSISFILLSLDAKMHSCSTLA